LIGLTLSSGIEMTQLFNDARVCSAADLRAARARYWHSLPPPQFYFQIPFLPGVHPGCTSH